MRLSEAMMLAGTMFRKQARVLACGDAACALGGAYQVLGWMDAQGNFRKWTSADGDDVWLSWLKSEVNFPTPCNCEPVDSYDEAIRTYGGVRGLIAHLFNEHVMGNSEPKMTYEQLCDFVAKYEPKPEAPLIGVDSLIDITDGVLKQNGYAITECEMCGKSFNVCGCDYQDYLETEAAMAEAEQEAMARGYQGR